MSKKTKMWVIYEKPEDHPDHYVVREWRVESDNTITPGEEYWLATSLESARQFLPEGLYNMGRLADDDPAIAEVWI